MKIFCLLGYNIKQFSESHLMFWWKTSPPSSGLKSMSTWNKQQELMPASRLFLACVTLWPWRWRPYVPPDISWLSADYMTLYPTTENLCIQCWENFKSQTVTARCLVDHCLIRTVKIIFMRSTVNNITVLYALSFKTTKNNKGMIL